MSGIQQLLLGSGQGAAVAVDPYFYSVTALLHGDGTNGGQNNTFLDSSTNNFTITRNGNTTQGSFSPFSQTGWSNYFDGSGDYLTTPNVAAFQFGSGDFTVEMWVYLTTPIGTRRHLFHTGNNGSGQFNMRIEPSGKIFVFANDSGPFALTGSTSLTTNQWYHIAFSRSGSTNSIFVNGAVDATATNTYSYTGSGNVQIGYWTGDTSEFAGYMSNLRVVKGTAVYTANFTVPTTPLTAISGTSLLTCQANRFLDASSNNFTITRNGDVSVQPFPPFNPTTAYSTSAVGGSGYFDGSGDYLSVPDAAAFTLGTSDFCMESWVYPTNASTGASESILGQWSSASYGWIFQYRSNALLMYYSTNGSSTTNAINASATVVNNAWNHIAFVRSGNTLSAYVNGTRVSTNASFTASIVNSSSTIDVGRNGDNSEYVTGYLNGTRLVVGSSVYDPSQSSITVPTAPLTAITNTSLLCNFTNGAIFDNAAVADYETVGNAQISTSVKKYGTGSLAFDGAGDYLSSRITPNAVFGSGDMTFECWVYPNTISGIDTIYDTRTSGSFGNESFLVQLNDGVVQVWAGSYSASVPVIASGGAVAASTWTFIAFSRTAGVNKLFINGTQVASNSNSWTQTIVSTNPYYIGQTVGVDRPFDGYIDDLRISKGIARYTYNFTPPTAEFPNIGGTVTLTADPYFDYTTLLLPGNGTNGAQNNTFLDSSTNAFTITRNGNTTQGTFSPFSQTGWGNYFDGSGDYLETPSNAAFTLGSSGDFTVECWVYATATPGNYAAFMTTWADANTGYPNRWFIGVHDSKIKWYNDAGASAIAASSNIQLNTWLHVAAVRSGSTITLYINGTAIGTQTTSQSYTTQGTVKLGYSGTGGNYFYGYISNARVVKGTAVYTANFTPPTAPLTAITNTSLLTCQSNRFIDNSTNAFAITANGDVSVQAFSPFNPTAAWSAATNGGSGYFDGSGDYLDAGSNSAFSFGTGAYTVEAWVFVTARSSSGSQIFANDTTGGFAFEDDNSLGLLLYSRGTANILSAGSSNRLPLNSWAHVAIVRSGTGSNQTAIYLNGTQVALGTDSTNWTVTGPAKIGSISTAGYDLNGYISNFRIVKGTAVYTAAFTPPTAPLTAISGTSLLTNFTNAGIYDATSKNDLETVGNTQISTTQSKFGGSSMYFDGSGDYIPFILGQNLNFGTGDFTFETWVRFSSVVGGLIIGKASSAGNISGGFTLYLSASGTLRVYGPSVSGTVTKTGITANTWYHVAVTRYGNTFTLWVDGISAGTFSDSGTINNTDGNSLWGIGNWPLYLSGTYLYGYLQDFRLTKGIARYTSNFTPPTTAFLTL